MYNFKPPARLAHRDLPATTPMKGQEQFKPAPESLLPMHKRMAGYGASKKGK